MLHLVGLSTQCNMMHGTYSVKLLFRNNPYCGTSREPADGCKNKEPRLGKLIENQIHYYYYYYITTVNTLLLKNEIISVKLRITCNSKTISERSAKVRGISFFCLPHCWLEDSKVLVGHASGHLDAGFLGFPPSSIKCGDLFQIPSSYCKLLM